MATHDIVVNLDVQDIILNPVVRVSEPACKVVLVAHLDLPSLVARFAIQHLGQELEILFVLSSFHKDDTVEHTPVLDKIPL